MASDSEEDQSELSEVIFWEEVHERPEKRDLAFKEYQRPWLGCAGRSITVPLEYCGVDLDYGKWGLQEATRLEIQFASDSQTIKEIMVGGQDLRVTLAHITSDFTVVPSQHDSLQTRWEARLAKCHLDEAVLKMVSAAILAFLSIDLLCISCGKPMPVRMPIPSICLERMCRFRQTELAAHPVFSNISLLNKDPRLADFILFVYGKAADLTGIVPEHVRSVELPPFEYLRTLTEQHDPRSILGADVYNALCFVYNNIAVRISSVSDEEKKTVLEQAGLVSCSAVDIFRVYNNDHGHFTKHEAVMDAHGRRVVAGYHSTSADNVYSILTSGLNTLKITHGRAYGDGIYHAYDYRASAHYGNRGGQCITMVNNVIDAPGSWVSSSPYIVVPDNSWFHTRYIIWNRGAVSNNDLSHKRSRADMERQVYDIPKRTARVDRLVCRPRDMAYFAELPVQPVQVPGGLLMGRLRECMELHDPGTGLVHISPRSGWWCELGGQDNDAVWSWSGGVVPDPSSELAMSMACRGVRFIEVQILFGPDYPQRAPMVRVVHPRFRRMMDGGSGKVSHGGTMCSSMFYQDWNPCYSIEAVMTHVVELLSAGPDWDEASLDVTRWNNPYSYSEAKASLSTVASLHNWSLE